MISTYKGKVAMVTGASKGLGRALAHELARRHSRLALVDVAEPELERTQTECKQLGAATTIHCIDVACEQQVARAAAEIASAYGTVHLVINSAAISASAAFQNMTSVQFSEVFQVNFFGIVNVCRTLLPYLRQHGEAQIVNVSSSFAWAGYPRKSAYAASKAATRAFSESLRLELQGNGIGVTVLYPGLLRTSLVVSGMSDSEKQKALELAYLSRHGSRSEDIARRCLNRLLSNPPRIVIGARYRVIDAVARLSPNLCSALMQYAAKSVGF